MKRHLGKPGIRARLAWCGLAAFVALAAPLPASAARKPKAMATYVVEVSNHRTSPVLALSFLADQDDRTPPNLLKTPLKPGQSRKVSVPAAPKVCSFSVSGRYEDGTDIEGTGLDLCNDHTLVLVD
jgi:hypothetical protein